MSAMVDIQGDFTSLETLADQLYDLSVNFKRFKNDMKKAGRKANTVYVSALRRRLPGNLRKSIDSSVDWTVNDALKQVIKVWRRYTAAWEYGSHNDSAAWRRIPVGKDTFRTVKSFTTPAHNVIRPAIATVYASGKPDIVLRDAVESIIAKRLEELNAHV